MQICTGEWYRQGAYGLLGTANWTVAVTLHPTQQVTCKLCSTHLNSCRAQCREYVRGLDITLMPHHWNAIFSGHNHPGRPVAGCSTVAPPGELAATWLHRQLT